MGACGENAAANSDTGVPSLSHVSQKRSGPEATAKSDARITAINRLPNPAITSAERCKRQYKREAQTRSVLIHLSGSTAYGRTPRAEVKESLKDDAKENIRANGVYREQQAASKARPLPRKQTATDELLRVTWKEERKTEMIRL
ncbi:hypothetical protein ROHU_018231 [Labeo rohita]|uniref:Uncharacterized protein n=1 Tax=Labeo rohita TaxID=84645 RepID=A0A498NF32_LABRO|nr:hypothetical protein ROHU_018231 [Labeo rohita]